MHGTYIKINCTNARYIHQNTQYKCTVNTLKHTVQKHGTYIKIVQTLHLTAVIPHKSLCLTLVINTSYNR
jgi:hypothetical protein